MVSNLIAKIISYGLWFIFILNLSINLNLVNAQIHRAQNPNSYYLKYDTNLTKTHQQQQQQHNQSNDINDSRNFYLTWLFSVIGISLVGLSGILPVAILPRLAHDHDDLGIDFFQFKFLVYHITFNTIIFFIK